MSTDIQKKTSYLPDELIERIIEYIVEIENVKKFIFVPLPESIANNFTERQRNITTNSITSEPNCSRLAE